MAPKVSIIIPAYNVARYIGETLQSVFAQTFRDYEIFVVDDGSTDDLKSILKPFISQVHYQWQENKGISAARNLALRSATGAYVALLDADDIWMPTFLERLLKMLEQHKEASIAFPNAEFFGDTPLEGQLFQSLFPCSEPITFARILKRECNIFCGSVIRRDAIAEIDFFDPTLTAVEDFDLWLRLAQRGHKFVFTTTPLVRYRRRSSCLSRSTKMFDNYLRVLDKVLASPLPPEQRSLALSERDRIDATRSLALGKECLLNKDYQQATEYFRQANRHFRRTKLSLVLAALSVAPGCVRRAYRQSQGLV